MPLVQAIEDCPKIEVFSFVLKIELPLHRQLTVGDFSFCFLCHNLSLRFRIFPHRQTFYRGPLGFTSEGAQKFLYCVSLVR